MLRRQVQEDPLGFLASQFSLLGEFQSSGRYWEKKIKVEKQLKETPNFDLWPLCVCAHTYPHINTYAGTYKNIYNK